MNKSLLNLLEEKDKYKYLAKKRKEVLEHIYSKIYCIGGPLNDNILKFTPKQMVLFSKIAKEIRYCIG